MLKIYILQIIIMKFGYVNSVSNVNFVEKSQLTIIPHINVKYVNVNIIVNVEE